MEDIVERPEASKHKIHSRDQFELCYLRHQYLRRVKFNPTATDMAPYTQIVTRQAKNTFYTYENLLKMVGFELDDLIAIARIHLVSFLGLYKLNKVPKKYEEFLDVFHKRNNCEAQPDDIESKDRANLTIFMKQRMEDVVRVCRQKARNIKGMPVEEFYVFYGAKKPPKDLRLLMEDHEKYGFRKLDMGSFKSIKKKNNIKNNDEAFKFAGYWYIAVPLEKRSLGLLDFTGAGLDPYDSIHNRNPEELLFDKFEEDEYERKKAEFKSSTLKRQKDRVQHFIAKHKGNPAFREEIMLAKKFLKSLRE